jgi:hypothetical protein
MTDSPQIRNEISSQSSKTDMVEATGSNDCVSGLWRVPIARGYVRGNPQDVDDRKFLRGFEVLMGNQLPEPSVPDTVMDGYYYDDSDFGVLRKYEREWITYNQRAFIDGGGRPGLGPQAMEAGDSIVIFAGGCAPFALREQTIGDGKYYRLLGSVYVYGLMDGEVMEGDVQFEDIVLV